MHIPEDVMIETQIESIKVLEQDGRKTVAAESLPLLEKAGQILKEGGLVAFPTETVYGLGGDAFREESSAKIYEAKGRPSDNPLIVHICRWEDMDRICARIPDSARILAEHFWPGPLTMILPKKPEVPDRTTGGLPTVAVRMPSDPVAAKLIEYAGGFVAAPSANLSGRPSPTRVSYVIEDLSGRVDMILDGGENEIGLESTIIDLSTEQPMVLRPGHITREELSEALGFSVELDPAVQHPGSGGRPKAPGMRYRHYAPKADMAILRGSGEALIARIRELADADLAAGEKVGLLLTAEHAESYRGTGREQSEQVILTAGHDGDPDSVARDLYAALRRFDDMGVTKIYSEDFGEEGAYEAVWNRLQKAAGYRVIS